MAYKEKQKTLNLLTGSEVGGNWNVGIKISRVGKISKSYIWQNDPHKDRARSKDNFDKHTLIHEKDIDHDWEVMCFLLTHGEHQNIEKVGV